MSILSELVKSQNNKNKNKTKIKINNKESYPYHTDSLTMNKLNDTIKSCVNKDKTTEKESSENSKDEKEYEKSSIEYKEESCESDNNKHNYDDNGSSYEYDYYEKSMIMIIKMNIVIAQVTWINWWNGIRKGWNTKEVSSRIPTSNLSQETLSKRV